MKLLILVMTLSAFAWPVKADVLSTCHSACFKSKQNCNAQNMHTFNTCNQDLFACRASCESGKPQKNYRAAFIDISFHSILRLD